MSETPMKWEQQRDELHAAQMDEAADVKRHRLAVEATNERNTAAHEQFNHDRKEHESIYRAQVERSVAAVERQASALEAIARALGSK